MALPIVDHTDCQRELRFLRARLYADETFILGGGFRNLFGN
jgi:hypothetical protein